MNDKRDDLAPCGVLCAVCPSYQKSCLGCSSNSENQKRTSKWNCKIRHCCYEVKQIAYCAFCDDFPCKIIDKKLIKSHEGDKRFKYRHELPINVEHIRSLGIDEFVEQKMRDYTCNYCGGTVLFYHYKCNKCGKAIS